MSSLKPVSSTTSENLSFLSSLDAADLKLIENAIYRICRRLKKGYLKRNEFGELLSEVLTKGTLNDYLELFDLVDISREGEINWDCFSNYLLLDYYEREDRIKMTQVPQWQEIKNLHTPHKSSICRILQLKGLLNRYCTVSKDGMLCIMDQAHELKRVYQINTNPEEIRSKDLWITDAVLLPNINKIAFSTTSREIWIYDMSPKGDFVCQFKITGLKYIVFSMNYWHNKNDINASLLAFGDTGGFVHALFFHNTTNSLFEMKRWKSEQSQGKCFQVDIEQIIDNNFSSASCLSYKAHSAWVRQITFIPLLECFLTCSTTSVNSIVLAWLGKSRNDVRITKFKIPLGINGFDYQETLNLIASAGINNHVCLWNPYVASKPVGVLRGHMQVIVAVQFIHTKNQLISFSKDKVLRIWDINLQICVQRLAGIFPKGPDVNILLFYDQEMASMFVSFNSQLHMLKMKQEVKQRVISHDSPITEIIYNEKYDHIISADESSCLTIWFLNTGQKVKHINEAHGNAEITALCLDHSGTRILSAGTDGNVKVWDINGNCHHVLVAENGEPCEISRILYLKRMIVAVGWSKVIGYFPLNSIKTYYVHPVDWKGKQQHFDDIFGADFCEPRTLVTVSYDGDIVFWNSNTQNSIRKIVNQQKQKRNNRLPPIPTPRSPSKSLHTDKKKDLTVPTLISPRLTPYSARYRSSSLNQNSTFVTVTFLAFMKSRNASNPNIADLYSCHSDGTVQFWNSLTCEKLGEFEAFEMFGSLVSCTDKEDRILAVGGDPDLLKIWDISDHLSKEERHQLKPNHPLTTQPPNFLRSFSTHIDNIRSIKVITKKENIFIITASADCSINIHTLQNHIGTFGQTEHWNINDLPSFNWGSNYSFTNDEVNDIKAEQHHSFSHDENIEDISFALQETDITETDQEPKVNGRDQNLYTTDWECDALKKVVGDINKRTKPSKHPISYSDVLVRKNCPYSHLETKCLSNVMEIEKPDFLHHPEKYFLDREELNNNLLFDLQQQASDEQHDLVLKHDEKSIFPKYILDLDMKLRCTNRMLKQKTKTLPKISVSRQRPQKTV